MGYTTQFYGTFKLDRRLSVGAAATLIAICGEDTRDLPGKYPGFVCQWELTDDGTGIEWDGGEKFYDYIEWLQWIIDTVLKPDGVKLTGVVNYAGRDARDCGIIRVEDDQHVRIDKYPAVSEELQDLIAFKNFVLSSQHGAVLLEQWKGR